MSLQQFLRGQRRKRWCRHLQRVCGSKQLWEVLLFSGRFDVDTFREIQEGERKAAAAAPPALDAEEPATAAEKQRKIKLAHEKAEAKSRYNEGQRLYQYRQQGYRLNRREEELLSQFESGALLRQLNIAVEAFGHGRLWNASGQFKDIGGSTGGGARRVLDSWKPADLCQFFGKDAEGDRAS